MESKVQLAGDWAGWKVAGRELVSPDGIRIPPHVLRHVLHQWRAATRYARPEASGTVVPMRRPRPALVQRPPESVQAPTMARIQPHDVPLIEPALSDEAPNQILAASLGRRCAS